MAIRFQTVERDDYLREIDITVESNLCIITGLNGSGKSRLLENISNGRIALYVDEENITTRRILSINQNSFDKFSSVINYNVRRTADYGQDLGSALMPVEYGHKSFDTVVGTLKNLGLRDEDFSPELNDAIAKQDISRVMTIVRALQFNTYQLSISQALKNYYDSMVSHDMNVLAKARGFEVDEIKNGINVEELLNSILSRLKLNYEIYGGEEYKKYAEAVKFNQLSARAIISEEAASRYSDGKFSIRLINKDNGSIVDIGSLSQGEKNLLSIASIIIEESQFKTGGLRPIVLLIDEPDAHLHPEYAALLIDILQSEFIEKLKFSIVLTSHSPITVASSGLDNIITMKKGLPVITHIDSAVNELLAGLPHIDVLNRKNVFVFTESHKDANIYNSIFSIVAKDNNYKSMPIFIPSSHGDGGGNCELVKHLINNLPDERIFHGVIDWDLVNVPADRLHVMSYQKRYTMENVIFDPFCLIVFLIIRGHQHESITHLPSNITLREFLKEESMHYNACLSLARYITADLNSQNETQIRYRGGNSINILSSYLQTQGHELEKLITDKIPQLKRYNQNLVPELVKVMREYPEIVPSEFEDLFAAISSRAEIGR